MADKNSKVVDVQSIDAALASVGAKFYGRDTQPNVSADAPDLGPQYHVLASAASPLILHFDSLENIVNWIALQKQSQQ